MTFFSKYKLFILIHGNASETIVCKMAAILSRGRWVNVFIIAKHFLCLPTRGTWFNWYRAYIFQCFICLNEMCVFVCDVCVCVCKYVWPSSNRKQSETHSTYRRLLLCMLYVCMCGGVFLLLCIHECVWVRVFDYFDWYVNLIIITLFLNTYKFWVLQHAMDPMDIELSAAYHF